MILRSTDHHGGLAKWFAGTALQFRYDYKPTDPKRSRRDTTQTIDLLSARAYHVAHAPIEGRFAWDGTRAWASFPPEKIAARFWALTPYYFVAMPFVLGDPGVRLQISQDDPADAGLPPCDVVRVTFDQGTGDAPDDYYVVYLAKESGRLVALRYVVSYKPFMASKGVSHTPEKLLVYEDYQEAGPLTLARTHRFYAFADGKRGSLVTVSTVSDVQYGAQFDAAQLTMPAGAQIDTSMDALAND
ncbi:MAG: hypothetical protein R3C68_12030 [Myxococcota bacterium]